ncbi:Uncharacterised protein [Chlamydia trachomatis]|nr:Uncharacterised protein [Chlamydia trachomatis]
MVLVSVRRQSRQNCRVHVRLVGREQGLVAEIHQRLVRVVAQELLHVLGEAERIVEILGVLLLILVELVEERVGVILELIAALGRGLGDGELILVADVVAVNGFVADDEADEVSGVRQLGVRRPVHRSVEAGVEEEGLEHRRGNLTLGRIVAFVVGLHDFSLLLEGGVLLGPAEGLVDLLGRQEG